jgi:hypothetical protein
MFVKYFSSTELVPKEEKNTEANDVAKNESTDKPKKDKRKKKNAKGT